jgi:uncharacterized protein
MMTDHEHSGDMDHLSHQEHHLAIFRAGKDEFMRTDPRAPLGHEEQHAFTGLSYYPFNPDLALELPLDRDVSSEPVKTQTSTGEEQEYRRMGKVRFEVDGEPAELTIFGTSGDDLFLPMRDATSGKETYGAGRYLEPEMLDDGTVLVDFNYLYNPFCAYNEQYSCPLPPMENWLKVPIRAGEKTFHE